MNQAEEDESFYNAIDEEAINVDSLLVEPRSDQVSVGGVWCFEEDNLGECMKIEDVPCRFSVLGSNARLGDVGTTKLDVPGVLPHEAGGENLLRANGVSSCDDYFLGASCDIAFAEGSGVDYGSRGLYVGNSCSESQIPCSGDKGNHGISSLFTESMPESGCLNNFLGKTTHDLRGSMSCNPVFGTSVVVKSSRFSTLFESETVDICEDVQSLCNENDKDNLPPHFASNGTSCLPANWVYECKSVCQGVETEALIGQDVATSSAQDASVVEVTQKRLRKPTKRYIDESSDLNLKNCKKRKETSSVPKVKSLGVRHAKHCRQMGSKAKVSSSEISFGKAIQVPFISQVPVEYQKNHTAAVVEHCVENYPIVSEDDSETTMTVVGGNQRKLHRLWTVSEVKKLIDGVAHFGVGKWTHIKRLLFSSSAHRTPVDLKDKWRNLLKASCALKGSKIEVEQKRSQPWRPLPKSILCRVRELANVYPYPREGNSKISKSKFPHAHHVASPARIRGNRGSFP